MSEALANAAKHAKASAVHVQAHTADGRLRLLVSDDGVGGAGPGCGSGLISLADRVQALGGTITIVSPDGQGTTLRVELPHRDALDDPHRGIPAPTITAMTQGDQAMMAVARARMIGSIGWAVILTALVAWEAVGLMAGRGWPTLSHITRELTRSPVGRWVLFGAWLWLGWHLFIRGWQLFLRGPLAEGPRPSRGGSGFRELLAEVLVLGATLVVALTGLLRHDGRDGESERRSSRRPVGFGALLVRVLLVAASCYGVLVGLVGLFVLVAGSDPSHLLRGAAVGGAILAFGVVAPGFLILSLVDAGIARLRRGRSAAAR